MPTLEDLRTDRVFQCVTFGNHDVVVNSCCRRDDEDACHYFLGDDPTTKDVYVQKLKDIDAARENSSTVPLWVAVCMFACLIILAFLGIISLIRMLSDLLS